MVGQVEIIGGWYFLVKPCRVGGKWLALAKRSPFVNGDPILEPGELWFQIADTKDDAARLIKAEVLN